MSDDGSLNGGDTHTGDQGSNGNQGGEDQTARELRKARQEAKQHRELAQSLQKRIEEYESAGKSEMEKLTERAAKAEQQAQQAIGESLRYQVAVEKGLPPALARRLQGATREELQKDADELLGTVAGGRRVPDAGNHTQGGGPQPNDPNRFLREKMARR